MFQIRLKELRELKGLSQAALGEALGVKQSTVGMWESGKSYPPKHRLESLADYFDVPIDYLLGHDDPPSAPANINPLEEELLSIFRTLPTDEQMALMKIVRSMAHVTTKNLAAKAI